MGQDIPHRGHGDATFEPPRGAATLIIGQRVHAGREDDYRRWQRQVNAAAERFPGFEGSDVTPPTGVQEDWLSVLQFGSLNQLQDWLNSAIRLDLIDKGRPLFDGPGTVQVLARDRQEPDTLVTVVVTHRVADDKVEDFLAWQKRVDEAESAFPGFRGSEVFRPIEGIQEEWIISYRFDTAEHLDAWLTSGRRRELLSEADHFGEFTLRTIDHSFGSWFSFGDKDESPPSDFRTSIAVWVGLYPTVVLLSLLTRPLGMPLWLGLLVGNLLSSFAMTYLTMPYYVHPLLGWWLKPRAGQRETAVAARGFLLVFAVTAFWAVVFYLVTVHLLKLN
ncbi:antibiotic biosynthesis monooxygenase [Mycolicibacterium sp. S2-37]|uniref:antibiotic biosynthesis monooxygenase n=1 Tax=Mycolicibacterium sp. S2-37 TaxID=2810297 RepID=UPI001A94AAB7|nr:antibiotic biosynthesis monooxygenase [Mycolicibacterium sp. S2-37]MBO0681344.1 antibiotic biosynthesis monooxygenase [Mycolicibacterium sp. S2-37]